MNSKNEVDKTGKDIKPPERVLEDELIKGVKKESVSKLPLNNKVVLKALQEGEDGDAYLLIKLLKDRYAFDHATLDWYYWNDHFWRLDKINHIVVMIKEVINLYGEQKIFETFAMQQAIKKGDDKKLKKHEYFIELLSKRIESLRKLKRKKTIIQLAYSGLNSLGMTGEVWDKNPMLLACRNGVINLQEGVFTKGTPSDYIKTYSHLY